jgi:hypothetical protein
MVHGANYAPMPQHIVFCLQTALSALLGMYLWHADAKNAIATADRPKQIH